MVKLIATIAAIIALTFSILAWKQGRGGKIGDGGAVWRENKIRGDEVVERVWECGGVEGVEERKGGIQEGREGGGKGIEAEEEVDRETIRSREREWEPIENDTERYLASTNKI